MEQPPEITQADPAKADPVLRTAPLMVRKASAWLEQQRPFASQRKAAAWGAMGLLFGAFPMAALIATVAHNEPIGAAAMLAMMGLSGVASYVNWRSWGRSTAWANSLVARWKQLAEMGIPADFAPEGESASTALDRMLVRIEALAGPERQGIRDAAVRAVERARRLEAELAHLDQVATGEPEADAAIDAAREHIHTELARTRARVAEVYAGLVDLEAGRDEDAAKDLEQALARVAAELEVQGPPLPREPLPSRAAARQPEREAT